MAPIWIDDPEDHFILPAVEQNQFRLQHLTEAARLKRMVRKMVNRNPEFGAAIVKALETKLDPDEVAEKLIKLLRNERPDLSMKALEALTKIIPGLSAPKSIEVGTRETHHIFNPPPNLKQIEQPTESSDAADTDE